jgi:transposase
LDRRVLREDQWKRIAPLLPGKVGDPGRSAADNRLFLEAVLWIVRVGAPWRDLPESFGNWNSVFQRFRRWAKNGIFDQIFAALSDDADFEYVIGGCSGGTLDFNFFVKNGLAEFLMPSQWLRTTYEAPYQRYE